MASIPIDPLANPKGINLLCELCQKPAFLQCIGCRVTYYCGTDHQKTDWTGIHEKICSLLIPLRTKLPFLPTQDEQIHRSQQLISRQTQLIELTRTTGQKLLFEGKHDNAVPAAMQSLRFAIEVHGLASIELVPSYLILGEASIGLGRLSQAEEYLSQAQWTVLKTPECSNAIKSKLNRILGLLYSAKGDYEESLRYLANDVYYASEEFGTDDINTSGGYYHMANIFYRENRNDVADSLYARVIDIWYDHLLNILRASQKLASAAKGPLSKTIIEPENALDEAQEAEAQQAITSICEQQQQQNANADSVAKSILTVAMLKAVHGERNKVDEYMGKLSEHEGLQSLDKDVIKLVTTPF